MAPHDLQRILGLRLQQNNWIREVFLNWMGTFFSAIIICFFYASVCKVADWFLAWQGSVRLNLSHGGKHGDVWTCRPGRWVTREGNKVVAIFILEMESKQFSTALCGGKDESKAQVPPPHFGISAYIWSRIVPMEGSLAPPLPDQTSRFPTLPPSFLHKAVNMSLSLGGGYRLFFSFVKVSRKIASCIKCCLMQSHGNTEEEQLWLRNLHPCIVMNGCGPKENGAFSY